SIPLSTRVFVVTETAVRGEGEDIGSSLPRVEQVASCDLFYPGLSVSRPSGALHGTRAPARDFYFELSRPKVMNNPGKRIIV
ncbi:MAG: hypothetical protein ACRD2L_03040, partial [Terriglobia bacterium]